MLDEWKPQQLFAKAAPKAATKVTTDISMRQTPGHGPSKNTRTAGFYDRHLGPKLVLSRVRCLKTLVDDIAGTVNKTARDVPLDHGTIPTQIFITRRGKTMNSILKDERGVAEIYKSYAAHYCLPIASTLALHPSSSFWDSLGSLIGLSRLIRVGMQLRTASLHFPIYTRNILQ